MQPEARLSQLTMEIRFPPCRAVPCSRCLTRSCLVAVTARSAVQALCFVKPAAPPFIYSTAAAQRYHSPAPSIAPRSSGSALARRTPTSGRAYFRCDLACAVTPEAASRPCGAAGSGHAAGGAGGASGAGPRAAAGSGR